MYEFLSLESNKTRRLLHICFKKSKLRLGQAAQCQLFSQSSMLTCLLLWMVYYLRKVMLYLYRGCKSDGVQMHDKLANQRPLMLVLEVPEEVLP